MAAIGAFGGLEQLLQALQGAAVLTNPRLIVRSRTPQDLETPVSLLTSWITPNDLFFVRSHLPAPNVETAKWALTVFFLALGLATLAAYVKIGIEHAGNVGERYVPTWVKSSAK